MLRRCLLLLAALALGSEWAAGQEQITLTTDSKGQLVVTPEMEAMHRRQLRVLEDPNSFTFRITWKEEENPYRRPPGREAQGSRFKAGEEVGFEVWVTNTTAETFKLGVQDTYEGTKPQLFKDGELIQYSKAAAETLEKRKILYTSFGGTIITLEPNQPHFLSYFDLKYWYEPLEPGNYRLLLKYNLAYQKWFDLPPVDFEVVR